MVVTINTSVKAHDPVTLWEGRLVQQLGEEANPICST